MAISQSVSCHCWEQIAKYPFGQLSHQASNTSRAKAGTAASPWFLTPSCVRAGISLPADPQSKQSCRWGTCIYVWLSYSRDCIYHSLLALTLGDFFFVVKLTAFNSPANLHCCLSRRSFTWSSGIKLVFRFLPLLMIYFDKNQLILSSVGCP